jgi:hypothetical protein
VSVWLLPSANAHAAARQQLQSLFAAVLLMLAAVAAFFAILIVRAYSSELWKAGAITGLVCCCAGSQVCGPRGLLGMQIAAETRQAVLHGPQAAAVVPAAEAA